MSIESPKKYVIASAETWVQVPPHPDMRRKLRTRIFPGSATLLEVLAWAQALEGYSAGDVILTDGDDEHWSEQE